MAGIWPSSGQQIFDATTGKPIVGAIASFFEAGTTTPLDTYKEYGLATRHPANVPTDANGRWPNVFLADGFYKVRLRQPGGSLIWEADSIPVIGVSTGGSTGAPVDPDALADVGDVKANYGDNTLSGWVRCNGRTIGSATSGATERANDDTETLFLHLWAKDENLAVSSGRGASAAADWAANKTIALPDMRGRVLAGVDEMGGAASGRIRDSYTGTADSNVVGGSGGADAVTLAISQIPAHTHSGMRPDAGGPYVIGTGGGTFKANQNTGSAGGGGAHLNVQPFILITWYIKL